MPSSNNDIESPYAWLRLCASLALITIGAVGMYAVIIAIPVIELEFGSTRSQSAAPYSMIMLGWAIGTFWMGKLFDRFGIQIPIFIGIVGFGSGFVLSAYTSNIWTFAAANGLLIGMLGTSSLFAPLMADVSHWFDRRRGIAIALAASGQYAAGAIWPTLLYHFIEELGWRQTYIGIGIFCVVSMLPLSLIMHRRITDHVMDAAQKALADRPPFSLGMSDNRAQIMLCIAGISCCVAMAMPQVHLISMCVGLGFGPAVGAEMLAVMLGCGVISRLSFGVIMDRFGGLHALLLASGLQCIALFFFLPVRGLVPLYLVSAMFGLFQGGLVPCYALIIREYFKPSEAGARIGLVVMGTLTGMALGAWMSGAIYDWTRSYTVAFLNGIGWNFVNIGIVVFLIWRRDLMLNLRHATA